MFHCNLFIKCKKQMIDIIIDIISPLLQITMFIDFYYNLSIMCIFLPNSVNEGSITITGIKCWRITSSVKK